MSCTANSCPYVTNVPENLIVTGINRTYTVGELIYFQCLPGFFPDVYRTSACESTGKWSPNPEEVVCQSQSSKHNSNFLN